MNNYQPVTILLVEDDVGHARLIERNLRRAGVTNEMIILDNGEKAIKFLFEEKDYLEDGQLEPVLILLDLNLPVLDGYAVLKLVKEDERTKHIPVIVLTTTDDPQEVSRCYALGCNVYITKPVSYKEFSEALRRLGLFLAVVKIPDQGDDDKG